MTVGAHAQTETTLFNLQGTNDGNYPFSGVRFDAAGNLYGTTVYGGGGTCNGYGGCGAVYEISPPTSGSGPWTEIVLHTFTGGSDGGRPYAALVFDNEGNLYGTTTEDGDVSCSCGSVFKLSPSAGEWKETTAEVFIGSNGNEPQGPVVFDSAATSMAPPAREARPKAATMDAA